MRKQESFSADIVLGKYTLTIVIDDSREGFTDAVFNQVAAGAVLNLPMLFIHMVTESGFSKAEGEARVVTHESSQDYPFGSVSVGIRLQHHMSHDEHLKQDLVTVLQVIVEQSPKMIDQLLAPPPDVAGFLSELDKLKEPYSPEKLKELAEKYGMSDHPVVKSFLDDAASAAVTIVMGLPLDDFPLGGRSPFAADNGRRRRWRGLFG